MDELLGIDLIDCAGDNLAAIAPMVMFPALADKRVVTRYGEVTSASFARPGSATYVAASGEVEQVGVDVPRVGSTGWILEGSATNKVTCAKSNPQGLTNISGGGVAIVNDAAELAKIGLSAFGSNVYKIDNSAGGVWVYTTSGGQVGNTNPYSCSAYVRGTGTAQIRLANDGGASTVTLTPTYSRVKYENRTPVDNTRTFVVGAGPNSIVYFTLPQLEEGSVCTSPIPGGTGAITRASEGADTSGNGLSIPLSSSMVASLSSGGEGTVLCGVWLPWNSSAIANSTNISLYTSSNSITSGLYLSKSSGGVYTINLSDSINTASIAAPTDSGLYIAIPQYSAALGRMRVGLFNPSTGALTWSSPTLAGATAYRGFFPIHSSNRVRFLYGGGSFPVHILGLNWSNAIISDAEAIRLSKEVSA